LERSLTVLLPVQNAQSTLAKVVLETLELASDLSERFELLIIDDGSSDATSEVAHELTRHYPQVRAVCHGKPLGRAATIRTGLGRSSGEMVLLCEKNCPLAITPDPANPAGCRAHDRRAMERQHGPSKPSRPNYLARLKEFAFGE